MDMDYVLASINPPSVWAFYPTAEARRRKPILLTNTANVSTNALAHRKGIMK